MTIYRRKTDSGFDEWLGEENKAAVIRCRCVQADDGRIASCNYARVYGVNLFVNENGTRDACVFLNYIFNPTPNDTNLEYAIR